MNIKEAGTLTILRNCLSYLSTLGTLGEYHIIALVYKKELANFPHIEYIETQWPKKRWVNRLWYEYVSLKMISKKIGPVYLWLSLHDTTPNVHAEKQAVYCHNPFPFYKWKCRELFFTPKIVLFALFSKLIYRKGIHKNNYVIVQQQWLKNAFKPLFNLSKDKVVVAIPDPPNPLELRPIPIPKKEEAMRFVFAASPNSHKNFECLCAAAALLEQEGVDGFKVYITVSGKENAYAKWLYKKWGDVRAIQWIGFQTKKTLFEYYSKSDCLVFPSKVETWGLPISEFATLDKPMLLADLPYAKETAAGSKEVCFFNPDRPDQLAEQMKQLIQGKLYILNPAPMLTLEQPVSHSWKALFDILLA